MIERAQMKSNGTLFFLFIIALYLFISLIIFHEIGEDSFIYFRIAANIANGHGWVFNVGGDHIEAGSGFVWQLILALLYYFHLNIIIAAKTTGIAFGCLALYLVYLISRECISDKYLQFAPAAFLTVSIPFYCTNQSGHATAFFLCTVLALVYVCCKKKLYPYWYLFAFVVFCERLEGVLYLLAVIPFLIFKRASLPHIARDICFLIILVCSITFVRIYYFHDLVFHPFYFKMNVNFASGIVLLLTYIYVNFLMFLLLPAVPAFFVKRFWIWPMIVIVPFLIVTTFGFVLAGDDVILSYTRKILPAITFAFIVAVSAIDRFYKKHFKLFFKIGIFAFIVIVLCFANPLFYNSSVDDKNKESFFLANFRCVAAEPRVYISELYKLCFKVKADDCTDDLYHPQTIAQHLVCPIGINTQATVGKFIKLNYPEGISVVYDQMGQTPWYAGLDKTFIDSAGLTDRTLGFYKFGKRYNKSLLLRLYNGFTTNFFKLLYPSENRNITTQEALDYVFNKNPELIMIHQYYLKNFPDSLPAKIEREPRFQERYELKYVVNKVVNFYQSRNLKTAEPLKIPKGCIVETISAG